MPGCFAVCFARDRKDIIFAVARKYLSELSIAGRKIWNRAVLE